MLMITLNSSLNRMKNFGYNLTVVRTVDCTKAKLKKLESEIKTQKNNIARVTHSIELFGNS